MNNFPREMSDEKKKKGNENDLLSTKCKIIDYVLWLRIKSI